MFYSNDIQDTRQLFFSSWQKYQKKQPLLPLEKQIVDVIKMHPEFHALLEKAMLHPEMTYFPELGQTNPFLHMGFHLAIQDQIATNRPLGITAIYQTLITQYKDASTVEHLLMQHLAECLWQAQRTQQAPDEISYIEACRQLLLEK